MHPANLSFIRVCICGWETERNIYLFQTTYLTEQASQSRGYRFGFRRPPPSTLVTWATVPFRRPEKPSWRPCRRRRRIRTILRRHRHRDSSCRVGPSIGPYPSANQDRRSHPKFFAGPSIGLGFRRSVGKNTLFINLMCQSDPV